MLASAAFDVADPAAVNVAIEAVGTLDVLSTTQASTTSLFTEVIPPSAGGACWPQPRGRAGLHARGAAAMQRAGLRAIVNVASEAGRIGAKGNAA